MAADRGRGIFSRLTGKNKSEEKSRQENLLDRSDRVLRDAYRDLKTNLKDLGKDREEDKER